MRRIRPAALTGTLLSGSDGCNLDDGYARIQERRARSNAMRPARIFSAALFAATALVLPGLGAAQQAGSDQYQVVTDEELIIQPFNLTVNQVGEMDVVSSTGERIGKVDEMLTDASGQVVAITVEAGDRKAVVQLEQLKVEGDRLVTSLTKAEVEALPEWDG
jgi:PRC-barrel domain